VGGGFNRGTAASVHANTNYDTSDWARGNYIWFIANEIYDSGTGIDMGLG
jgi:chloramphenicol 3-O-phosphotransferase